MKTFPPAGIAGVLLYSVSLFAAAQDNPITVVVTASRTAETVDETLVPVTVITREAIERGGATTLSEVLSNVPGVVITRNGGAGQQASLFLRGTESDHVLVLIDGVKAGSATLGTTPFHHIPLDQVDRIEVVRGPRSSLYGSEAIGGVIQIFTRRGGDDLQPSLNIGAGSHGTGKVSAGISGGSDKAWYSMHASAFTTAGFDVRRDTEPDDDGHENTALSVRWGGQVGERLEVEASLLNSSGDTEYDNAFSEGADSARSLNRVGHLRGIFTVNDRWTTSLLAGRAVDESEEYLDRVFQSIIETGRDQLTWQNDIAAGNADLIFGVDHIREEVYRTGDNYVMDSRDNTGIFTSFHPGFSAMDLEVSLRHDDNEQFGSETTGSIAMGWDLGDRRRATLSWGEAFKAPTFNELYWPGFGNPDLVAESARSLDVGLSGDRDNFRWSVNLFSTRVENLISTVLVDPETFTYSPVNIDEAEIEGLELTGGAKAGGWNLSGVLTLQVPRDARSGDRLRRRPQWIVSLAADRDFGRWFIGASVLSQGKSRDNPDDLDGFTVADLRAGVKLRRQWTLGVEINNIFDEEFETASTFNQDGTNVMATLRYGGE